MYKRNLVKTLTLLLLVVTFSVNAQHESSENSHEEQASSEKDYKTEIKEEIRHHVKDSYYFDFNSNSETEEYNGFSLPVILFDGGLKVFMSSKFHHGKEIAEVGGNYYKLYHNKIYKTNADGKLTYDEHHHPTNIKPLDFSITKSVFSILVVSIIVFLIFLSLAKSYAKNGSIPKGIGRFFEPIVIYIRDEIAIPSIGHKHYKKYMNFLLTVFFFIWFSNLIGITPFGMNITGNLAVTAALAFLTFLITQFTSKPNYWKHIFWMPGVPVPMKIILAPIELLGVFIKPFALMMRLYANIFAGHIVIYSILGLLFVFKSYIGGGLSFGLALVISILELLVAILQAYIFTMLSALYFGFASEEHELEHNE
ncbi:MAG: F0F1 ATP synthase subunit A [Lutibacter sp.]|uniref:F0F1 ATP synthase subunit A n=1 Tax=Lutibacter sp. TaxID=1925666 RepID=UPI00299EA1DC|nr:F0F1 ATP synthase subunit A [Lutibacter sp.]MDX1829641.1 F0F1 ATP synthase subunit A [Lutibacter sp.]